MSFGLLVTVLAVVVLISLVLYIVRENLKARRVKKRVIEVGVLWVTNQNNGVVAVCTKSDFDQASDSYEEAVQKGDRDILKRVSIWVDPTFTFWLEQCAQRPIHTGSSTQLAIINAGLLKEILGIQLDPSDNWLSYGLVDKDKRLFVPFAGGSTVDLGIQREFYGKKTLEEAREYLLKF